MEIHMDSLEDLLWKNHQTILSLGSVSKPKWQPPEDGNPGVLAAGDLQQACVGLAKLDRLKAFLASVSPA